MWTSIKKIFKGYSHQSSKDCRYCGGGRCMGMCGGGLAKLNKVEVVGILCLDEKEEYASIKNGADTVMLFDPKTHFGRIIMKKCSIGSKCKVQALLHGTQMEKLISIKKIS